MQINSSSSFNPTYFRSNTARPEQARDNKTEDDNSTKPNKTEEDSAARDKKSTQELDQNEKHKLEELKARDREVRTHEAAHKATAGQYATGGASFTYQRGPDGQLYATGGEVGISTGPVPDNPEATLQKANTIRAAALAPAHPSSQDMSIAAKATMMATEARAQIAVQQQNEFKARTETKETTEESKQQSQAKHYEAVAKQSDDSHHHTTKIDLMA